MLAFWNGALRRGTDGLLLLLLVAVAFLLGCYEMGDSDVWWHLRGGQWILEHGHVPDLDPFTFGSADRRWIDVHWSYQILLTLCHRAGGVAALVLLGATFGGLAFLVTLLARRSTWPVPALVLCWLPVLVLFAFRLDPRPEILSLFYLGCYLAILWRAEERPTRAWLLVPVQILWSNAQGLFILGPVVLLMFVAAHAGPLLLRRWQGQPVGGLDERRWWKHVGGATVAVGLACLANPYFLDGALFPILLYPKATQEGNPYKKYIDELMSPRDFVANASLPVAGKNAFFLALAFLLMLLPVCFLYPALWRSWQAAPGPRGNRAPPVRTDRPAAWLAGLAVLIGLLLLHVLTLGARGPSWLIALGDNVPLILLLGGGAAAALFWKRGQGRAAGLALLGTLTLTAWLVWLTAALTGQGRGVPTTDPSLSSFVPVALLGLAAAGLVLRRGGRLFPLLLAIAFGYLSLQSLQNWSRFALVAGAVLAWSFGDWAGQLMDTWPRARSRAVGGWALRLGLLVLLGLWIGVLVSDRYYAHTGEPRHLGFREQPLEFAHEAALFAGSPGLPERALVYDLGQTGVYDYHNAPRCKPFLDGRLEMPAEKTFKTYVAIEEALASRDPAWQPAVAALGNPLLLLAHEKERAVSESVLLAHPDWRCIYFDALAAIFVPRRPDIAADYPSVDFSARHFLNSDRSSVPNARGAAAREQRALLKLAAALPRQRERAWQSHLPLLLNALDRGERALAEDPGQSGVWIVLGETYRLLVPDLPAPTPTPAAAWSLERGIFWAQATYCFRRAVELNPQHAGAWQALYSAYALRRMVDAQQQAGAQWQRFDPKIAPVVQKQLQALSRRRPAPGLPESSASVAEQYGAQAALPWPQAERLAALFMHLGRPAEARRVWQQALHPPARALLLSRLASTFWVERRFDEAEHGFQAALEADPGLTEACWGLAMLYAQKGQARDALAACRRGLAQAQINARQRADLEGLRQLLLRLPADATYPPGK